MAEAEAMTQTFDKSTTPYEVIDAVRARALTYRSQYERMRESAALAMKDATECNEIADGYREKAESCEKWLDERAPDWREDEELADDDGS